MCTVESAWCDVPRMAVLLLPGMLHVLPPGKIGLILLDTTSFHTDNQVIGMLNSIGYKVAVLLGGITGELQPNVCASIDKHSLVSTRNIYYTLGAQILWYNIITNLDYDTTKCLCIDLS